MGIVVNYMKYYNFLLGATLLFSSCIKEEPLNLEADITEVLISESLINTNPIINNRNIVIYTKPGLVKVDSFALEFKITDGAIVSPASGSAQDFTYPVVYTVTSENGEFSKQYTISLVESAVPQEFDFESFEFDVKKNFTVFYEQYLGMEQYLWGSGNSAFSLLAGKNPTPATYPTRVTDDMQFVHHGKNALHLQTIATGALGNIMKMPIAAGNLFVGSIDASSLLNPITKMGLPFNKVPTSFEGYYKYVPGAKVVDKTNKVVPNANDECDIYAVFYNRVALQKKTGLTYLSNANSLTDESIVAIARIPSGAATSGDGLVKFDVPFQFIGEYNISDVDAYAYNLAIVFSSSKNGAIFQGAVGSKLFVDDVKVKTK